MQYGQAMAKIEVYLEVLSIKQIVLLMCKYADIFFSD